MRQSSEPWWRNVLTKFPAKVRGEIERGWSFNPKQQFTKSKASAKRKSKSK